MNIIYHLILFIYIIFLYKLIKICFFDGKFYY